MGTAADSPAGNLTGLWHGQYSYPVATRAPVSFSANLIQIEDSLGGSITERALLGRALVRTLFATIQGRRDDSIVSFLKVYEANSGPYTNVAYQGVLSEDGLEIDGDWIASGWSGRFLMIRAGGLAAKITRFAKEKV
jgi:hypothetical protein